MSGPRPLAMYGTTDAWRDSLAPVVVLAVFCLFLAVPLTVVGARKVLSGPAA